MKIKLTSVMVKDQEKALKFYTEILGFLKKKEIPMGEHKMPSGNRNSAAPSYYAARGFRGLLKV